MSSPAQSHARSHALLLAQKLFALRDSASPFTVVLDTLEQSGKPVLREFMARAAVSQSKTIYVSFSTLRRPGYVHTFIRARGKKPEALRSEIISHYHSQKILLIIDELNPLAGLIPQDLALFLSSLITSPQISLVSLYHTDIPLPSDPSSSGHYTPHPLTVLTHLATGILRVTSLHHAVERRRALNRSQAEPEYGLEEGKEGVLVGLGSGKRDEGLVVEMELRRRSGRAVSEKFFLHPSALPQPSSPSSSTTPAQTPTPAAPIKATSRLYLLADHPAFRDPGASDTRPGGEDASSGADNDEGPESTFNLGLTEKQRRDREGVVLPYFDAQTDIGAGEGGRILYEMGREDDFDDEEDEI
ncbi:Elongator complex protein 5 [Xylariaceae sp. FL0255]|nr:Elongator complex protein 5 [Xylariaceae sp. FL0255]